MKHDPSATCRHYDEDAIPASGERLLTPSGAAAFVQEERIEVRDPKGRLLFEYDAATGRGSLTMPTGNLALRAPEGDIELIAGRKVAVLAPEVSLASERTKLLFGEAEVRGIRVTAAVEQVFVVAERLEQVASSVFQRAKRVLRHVEDLEQLTAGRVRTLVEGAYSLKGEQASIQATDEVKIDGERVHLG